MPRPRQRIVVCDCFDCLEQRSDPTHALVSAANEAAARQEPPPKCCLFLCSGLLAVQAGDTDGTVLESGTLPHLNRLVMDGSQGFAAVRSAACQGSMSELAQLLGVYEDYVHVREGTLMPNSLPSLSSRYKGMQAALASNQDAARQLGAACSLHPSRVLDVPGPDSTGQSILPSDSSGSMASWLPAPHTAVERILLELGIPAVEQTTGAAEPSTGTTAPVKVKSSETLQDSAEELDMLIVHVALDDENITGGSLSEGDGGNNTTEELHHERASEALEWLDMCARHLNQVSAVRDTVLLCVMLTSLGQPYIKPLQPGGTSIQPGTPILSSLETSTQDRSATDAAFPVVRPPQSFQSREGKTVDVDLKAPVLVVRRLAGVVRTDRCQKLGVQECIQRSGMGGLLLDHVVPEIAYKLGRAPKYGA